MSDVNEPSLYIGYIELKPNQLNDVDWGKLFYFPPHNDIYLCTSVDFRNVRYRYTKY